MKKIRIILVFIILSLVIIFAFKSNSASKPIDQTAVINKDMIEIQNFSIDAHSVDLNTLAKGSMFLEEIEGAKAKLKIVSYIEVDKDDWGGVAFYIPNGWEITKIENSYPDDKTNLTSFQHNVGIWTSNENEWRNIIEVGRNRNYQSHDGGDGMIIIELNSIRGITKGDSFHFLIEVGSDEKEGVKIMGTDYVEIPFNFGNE